MPKIRAIDMVWLILLGALAALGMTKAEHSPYEWLVLLALGGVQIAEVYLGVIDDTTSAALSIAVKLTLCFWLVAETGGLESSYYLIFLLPVVSAATNFGAAGTMLSTLATSGIYLSFLLAVDYETAYVPPEGQRELIVRVLFFFLSAILVNRFATENRAKTEHLAQANRELIEAQAQVQRSERLAALGQLSAGLAHEIRNPLGVISASAELLEKNVNPENEVALEVSGFVRSEVRRLNGLVTRFLDFARPSQLQKETHDLNAVVERALSQLDEQRKGRDIPLQVNKKLAPLPPFRFDATLIESTVFNLLLNAYEAMPEGGTLRVETRRRGPYAHLEIADSGEGIPDEQLEDIFNPFFTTKAHGVGLGLAMVSKFVDSHDGTISVTSRPGQGSTFLVQLPASIEAGE